MTKRNYIPDVDDMSFEEVRSVVRDLVLDALDIEEQSCRVCNKRDRHVIMILHMSACPIGHMMTTLRWLPGMIFDYMEKK